MEISKLKQEIAWKRQTLVTLMEQQRSITVQLHALEKDIEELSGKLKLLEDDCK